MKSYGCAVYAHGIELHGDGRRRERGPLGWLYLRPALPRARGPRGEIRGFRVKSRQRLKWALANAVPEFRTHLTLTYHARVEESDADAAAARNRSLVSRAKRDLNRFLACLRREAGRYCWIQEFQSRGAVHFFQAGHHFSTKSQARSPNGKRSHATTDALLAADDTQQRHSTPHVFTCRVQCLTPFVSAHRDSVRSPETVR